ncbi:MAG: hypothetical protein GX451_01780 [Acholeplasmataceae bacterium]|nr:hypothetical protein [Acholeplasmataceae bacterium]
MIKKYLLGLFLAFVSVFSICTSTEAAFEYKPVAFVLIDYSQNVTQEDFLSWREQVRQAYHVPYYEIIKSSEPTDTALKVIKESGLSTSKLDKQTLQKIAAQIPAKVVVILSVNRMEERLVHSWGFYWHDEGDVLQQVIVSADIYIYKEENDKMLKKKLRYFETEDIPISTPASDVIKYEIRKLVNTMEKREQI